MTDNQSELAGFRVDTDSLYREEVFTDLRAASIRRMVPVKADGSPDDGRETLFTGETTLMTRMGPVPVHCPIEATSLTEAWEKFPEALEEAVVQLNERAQEMMRDEASRIVVPSAVPPGMGGGVPGASKLILDK